jgi:hypothetical protein
VDIAEKLLLDNQIINCSHYLPGTQENYNSFSSRNLMMEKGKELEFPEAALSTGNPGKL